VFTTILLLPRQNNLSLRLKPLQTTGVMVFLTLEAEQRQKSPLHIYLPSNGMKLANGTTLINDQS
jgi:hypothetical protein